MIHRKSFAMLWCAILCTCVLTDPAQAQKKESDQKGPAKGKTQARKEGVLRVAITRNFFQNFSDSIVKLVIQPFPEIVKAQTGLPGSIDLASNSDALAEQLANGDCHLAVFQSHEFLWARIKYPELEPLMTAVNKSTPLQAYLLVNRKSEVGQVADLEGKEVCFPSTNRPYAQAFLDYRCTKPGVVPKKFYSKVKRIEGTDEALDDLVDGQTDAVLAEKAAWERYCKMKPTMSSELKVLQESETFPSAVIAHIPGKMPSGWSEIFRKGMMSANTNPSTARLMMLVKISSFENIPEDFEARAQDILKQYPPASK